MRKYVSLETQEIQKNAERRHRNEQNRMKMLFRNALASDITMQNNHERQSYESNRVHAHNRQRRRNLLNFELFLELHPTRKYNKQWYLKQ